MEIYFLLVSIDRPLELSKYTNQTFIPQSSKACGVFINILMSKTLCLQKNANFLKSYKKGRKSATNKTNFKGHVQLWFSFRNILSYHSE